MSGRRGRGRGRGGGRPTKADQLMHGAIDHFGRMGYAEADVRSTVGQLIEVYGEDASSFLKEDDYRVVQDALFEKQEQEEQQQEEEPKLSSLLNQKEAAISEAPVASDMPIEDMHNEMPPGAELSVEGANPMLIDPRASEATMALLQLQELVVQGVPAMDGLANLRVIQTTKNTLPVDDRRCMLQFREAAECVECEMKPHLTGTELTSLGGC